MNVLVNAVCHPAGVRLLIRKTCWAFARMPDQVKFCAPVAFWPTKVPGRKPLSCSEMSMYVAVVPAGGVGTPKVTAARPPPEQTTLVPPTGAVGPQGVNTPVCEKAQPPTAGTPALTRQ